MSQLEGSLRRFQRRVRALRAWRGAALGGCVGAVVSVALAGLDYTGLLFVSWIQLALPVAAGLIIGAAWGLLRTVSAADLADSIDRRAGLRNRLSSALENEQGDFGEPLQADALASLCVVQPREAFPVRVSRWHGALILLLGVAALVFLLGNSPLLLSAEQKRDRVEMQEASKQVERVAKPLLDLASNQRAAEEERKLAERMNRLAAELQRGRIPKQEALAKANELAKQAEELSKERFEKSEASLARAEEQLAKIALEKLEQESGERIDPSLLAKTDEELAAERRDLQQKLDKASEQLAAQSGGMEERQKSTLRSQMEALKKAARGGQLTEQERKELRRLLQFDNLSAKQREALRKLLDGAELSDQDREALNALANALLKQLEGLSPEERRALEQQLKQVREQMRELELSEKAKKLIQDLMKRPEMREIQEILNKLKATARSGEQGAPQMSAEQMRELNKRLEQLAGMLKDEKAMREFLKHLKDAAQHAGAG